MLTGFYPLIVKQTKKKDGFFGEILVRGKRCAEDK